MKLILHMAETQVSAARVAEAIGSLRDALAEAKIPEDEARMLLDGTEIHGTLHPGDGQQVVPDSDLTMLLSACGMQRNPADTAHQILHKVAAAVKRQ